jgi:hypothetical protein
MTGRPNRTVCPTWCRKDIAEAGVTGVGGDIALSGKDIVALDAGVSSPEEGARLVGVTAILTITRL